MINAKASASTKPLRVLIAAGSLVNSEHMAARLTNKEDIQVVGYARKAIEALNRIESDRPDAVVLNLDLPCDSLIAVLQLIKRATPVPTVMVLAAGASDGLRERYLNAGADHVFTTTDFKCLFQALRGLITARNSNPPQ